MRRLPESVPIFGIEYSVRVVSPRQMRRVSPEGTDDHGCCDAIKKRIYINSADQIDEQWSSFSHEKYHAALKEAWLQEAIGLDLRHYEEAIVRLLERGLYPALRACGYGD